MNSSTEEAAVAKERESDRGQWSDNISRRLARTKTARRTEEILLVIDHDLTLWQKQSGGSWQKMLETYCGYGENGLSDHRHEGDRTTPIGAFPILHAFGTAPNPGTQMTYRLVTPDSYWSDEPATYNTWVESSTPISGEHLIDYYQYKYAMAIGFNQNPVIQGKGSAIFFHCRSYDHWTTAGCVSVTEEDMVKILQQTHDGACIIIIPSDSELDQY